MATYIIFIAVLMSECCLWKDPHFSQLIVAVGDHLSYEQSDFLLWALFKRAFWQMKFLGTTNSGVDVSCTYV